MVEVGTDAAQDVADILDHGPGLRPDIEIGDAHRINLDADEAIVRSA